MTNPIPYGENIAPPTCMTEAASCLKEMQTAIAGIKHILRGAGLWSPPVHSDHPPPLTDGELFSAMANVMQDINMIKQVLIDQGFCDNNELIPLTPRWRIDGQEHHHRQMATMEHFIRVCIERYNAGLPAPEWNPKGNKNEPSR